MYTKLKFDILTRHETVNQYMVLISKSTPFIYIKALSLLIVYISGAYKLDVCNQVIERFLYKFDSTDPV